jgi:hypothetical protein
MKPFSRRAELHEALIRDTCLKTGARVTRPSDFSHRNKA